MLNIISSLVLVASLGIILVIFLRKKPVLDKLVRENSSFSREGEADLVGRLEVWDEKINTFIEFFLRKLRMILLRGDNTVSRWLFSLKKNNHNGSEGMFFLGEPVDEKLNKEKEIHREGEGAKEEKVLVEEEIILRVEKGEEDKEKD